MSTATQDAVRLISEAEERLQQARSLLENGHERAREEGWPGERILAEVLAEGGSVTRERLYQLAAKHGMDRRGLGGFFRASGKGSLYEVPGMDRIILTPSGTEVARRLLESREGLTYEPASPSFAKVAEAPFAEDWESDEDSVYDRL
jgi:hypothetical protein